MVEDIKKLQQRIAYTFRDIAHLKTAMTHRSAKYENNERYEFLGDAVLGVVIAHALFKQFPEAREGKLTRMRAKLVRGETLAEIANELDIQAYLILGEGELKAGGRRRKSIQADAMEAIIGAIYLDSDFISTQKVILNLYQSRLEHANPDIEKDPKTLLQEAVQKQGKALPVYQIITKTGKAHELNFLVECRLVDMSMTERATGKSRREAEQAAASKLLVVL